MPHLSRGHRIQAAAWSGCVVVAACIAVAAVGTAHWPQISDDVLMHYVVFLIGHGLHPYRQVVDLNMPGSYGVDWLAGRLLGTGAASWRVADWLWMTVAGASLISATRSLVRGDAGLFSAASFAGFWAAAVFALLHVGDGVAQAGQRDFILAVLLLAGYALFFRGLRLGEQAGSRRSALLLFAAWGLCCGVAATIKPQAVVLPGVLLALLWLRGPRDRRGVGGLLAAGAAGVAVPLLAMVLWLAAEGSMAAFYETARGLMAYHAGMARHSGWFLFTHAVPSALLPIFVLSLCLVPLREGRRFQTAALLCGVAFGFFSFCLQGKAYPYQRYPLIAAVLLLAASEVAAVFAMPRSHPHPLLRRTLAMAMVLYGTLWLAPASTARALRYDWRSTPSLDALTADLSSFGRAQRLQGQVQCMDTMAGCITVLDRMRLVQSTGFLYDCYFFAPGQSPVKAALRARFLARIEERPPSLFVVTDQWCLNLPGGYARLAQWPAFADFLARNYALAEQRQWPLRNRRTLATWPFGYRIYARRVPEVHATGLEQ